MWRSSLKAAGEKKARQVIRSYETNLCGNRGSLLRAHALDRSLVNLLCGLHGHVRSIDNLFGRHIWQRLKLRDPIRAGLERRVVEVDSNPSCTSKREDKWGLDLLGQDFCGKENR